MSLFQVDIYARSSGQGQDGQRGGLLCAVMSVNLLLINFDLSLSTLGEVE